MMEKKYRINHYSTWRFLSPFAVPFCSFLLLGPLATVGLVPIEVITVVFYFLMLGIALTFLPIPKFYARSSYQARIYADKVVFECIEPFLWSKSKPTIQVNFSELKSYDFVSNMSFNVFKLKLQSGEKIRFSSYDNIIFRSDDLVMFFRDFKDAVEQYNPLFARMFR